MRQRKPKELEKRISECSAFLVDQPRPQAWKTCFPTHGDRDPAERDLCVEIGCGKGDFIIAKAINDPDTNYIGIEGQQSVLLRALEKAMWMSGLDEMGEMTDGETGMRCLWNLKFADVYVKSMKDLFDEGSLAGIYLNFSDPWPKKRHYKRRLTWRGRLMEYEWALKDGGFIEIKTDNDDLFRFTLEEIEACGWTPCEMSRDLHDSDLEARETMTEYEKRFHNAGKSINYVKIIL